jgi:hypothetical protein
MKTGLVFESTPKSYPKDAQAYAFTFFWILITRFVRAVICFLSADTISVTATDNAATASADHYAYPLHACRTLWQFSRV